MFNLPEGNIDYIPNVIGFIDPIWLHGDSHTQKSQKSPTGYHSVDIGIF